MIVETSRIFDVFVLGRNERHKAAKTWTSMMAAPSLGLLAA
eukprot:CAMPEP_0197684222 /NCGR_PEP_ID=MMETSP1338-20131121/99190_1 /TAXON_ID=43686 ORGANISM="Pelagodinium beii, Strain RCC1491" /NCGR_SAMPLE_ID=MMETSP1338 /ASSEMBLY_ACC=CAM_ASM_000754 /LENGTH=40 /DNA_ID= /DNA_START= /DNA_END= /DNA_ORIENTATION=